MRRLWRAAFLLVLAALLAAPALLLALRLGLLTPLFNLVLTRQLGPHTEIQVRVGSLRSDLLSFVELGDVVVLAPVGAAKLPLLTVADLRLEYRAWEAWRKRMAWEDALALARVRGLNIFLLRGADGAWNLGALGRGAGAAAQGAPGGAGPELFLPAARVELEDCQVVLNDEARGFHTSIEGVQGSLDARSLPLVAFSLNGRTEGKSRDDLSLAGELDRRDGSLRARLDLHHVPLARYLNYLLPVEGLSFGSGQATLSARLRRDAAGGLRAAGRAEISGGSLKIPGIARPLSGLEGAVAFDRDTLRFRRVRAHFLGSDWTASGAILDLAHPRFELELENPAFGLEALSEQVVGIGFLRLSGTARVQASLKGPAVEPEVQAQLVAPLAGLLGFQMNDVSARARLKGSRLEVEDLQARLWGGALRGRAAMGLGRGGRLDAALALEGAALEQADLHGRRLLPLSGPARVRAQAGGLLRDPQVDLHLETGRAVLGRLDLGALDLRAVWGSEGLDLRLTSTAGILGGGLAFGRGRNAQFRDTRVRLQATSLAVLARGLAQAGGSLLLPPAAVAAGAWVADRLDGQLSAELSLEGPVSAPAVWADLELREGRLFLKDGPLSLRDPAQGLPLTLRGAVGSHQGELRLGRDGVPLRLGLSRRRGGLDLRALGRYPLGGGQGRMQLAAEGDLRILEALRGFDEPQGRLRAELVLGGNPEAPLVDGTLAVSGFALKPAAYLAPLRQGELQAEFRGQLARLTQLRLRAGGEMSATGEVDLGAGWRGLRGRLVLRSDATGIRVQNWERVGSGSLALAPLELSVDGEGQPWRLRGRAQLSNALIVYAGGGKREAGPPARPWDVDLRVALGPNVWYEKRSEGGVELFDPSRWISGTLESVQETFQRPDVFFRLRPTDQDLSVRYHQEGLQIGGVLAIDRGRLTLMENDFEIRPERKPALIRFSGRRADVSAEAVGRLRYTRDNEVSGRPQQRVVDVVIAVEPLGLEELERSDLAEAFLNYSISFGTERPIEEGRIPPHQQREAVLNLVVLGDPLVDLQQAQAEGGGRDAASRLTEAQLNRLLSGEAKRQLAKWSRRGFKFLGAQLIDVLRVVPRFSYQSTGTGGVTTAGQASQQAQDSQLVFNDLTVEVGKSLGEQLYASVQWVRFGEDGLNSALMGVPSGGNLAVRNSGWRASLEYQISNFRTAEVYYSYSLDDNMQPKLYDPNDLWTAHSGGVRLRNSIPTDSYSPRLARLRRWEAEARP